jgi:hypothetical protein
VYLEFRSSWGGYPCGAETVAQFRRWILGSAVPHVMRRLPRSAGPLTPTRSPGSVRPRVRSGRRLGCGRSRARCDARRWPATYRAGQWPPVWGNFNETNSRVAAAGRGSFTPKHVHQQRRLHVHRERPATVHGAPSPECRASSVGCPAAIGGQDSAGEITDRHPGPSHDGPGRCGLVRR